MNIIKLIKINGECFKKIIYFDINDLINSLNNILNEYNTDIFIQLILNNIIINEGTENNNFNYYKINNLQELNNFNSIQVVFISK